MSFPDLLTPALLLGGRQPPHDGQSLLLELNRASVFSEEHVGDTQVSKRCAFPVTIEYLSGDSEILLVKFYRAAIFAQRVVSSTEVTQCDPFAAAVAGLSGDGQVFLIELYRAAVLSQ